MFIISKGIKNAKIITNNYLVGGVVAFYTGHACQLKCKTKKILDFNDVFAFFPQNAVRLYSDFGNFIS